MELLNLHEDSELKYNEMFLHILWDTNLHKYNLSLNSDSKNVPDKTTVSEIKIEP
jgi:hypothetical protein